MAHTISTTRFEGYENSCGILSITQVADGYQDAFTAFVADVHAAIRGGEPEGLPTFADGLRAAMLTESVLRSAADGSWVDVTEPVRVEAGA